MIPPRVLGRVNKFERAIRLQMRAKLADKSEAKHAVNAAKNELLKAIEILGATP